MNELWFEVCRRLNLEVGMTRDEAGLRRLYRAWCVAVPFDNIRKLVAHGRADGGPLPGIEARDFFENWMEHGAGGTCWSSSNALYSLAEHLGFDCHRATASMWDRGVPTHGMTMVRIDGDDWAIDSSILFMNPLLLRGRGQPGPLHPVEIEEENGEYVFWFEATNQPRPYPCRLLDVGVSWELYSERYEASRNDGPFNRRLFVRRNYEDRLVMLIGNKLWQRDASGQVERLLTREELVNELGQQNFSRALLDEWISYGGLDAAMEPEPPSAHPPYDRLPPSQRLV